METTSPQNSEKPWTILLYYKYVSIPNPEKFAYEHLKFCKSIGIKGRILIANNGINGTVGSPKEITDQYVEHMKNNELFADMQIKQSEGPNSSFKKIFVRYREELVTMKYEKTLDPNKEAGTYIEPADLNKLYESDEDFVIIDMRNDYEAAIGRFKNAITLPMQNFKQLPEIVEKELMKYKNKKVVTYCTGGIRCETATALLKDKGFKDVYQLHGGVHVYGQEFPDNYWEGKLYVFDERIAVPINTPENRKILSNCIHCQTPCDDYINCTNVACNKQITICPSCRTKWNDGCSEDCSKKPRPPAVRQGVAQIA